MCDTFDADAPCLGGATPFCFGGGAFSAPPPAFAPLPPSAAMGVLRESDLRGVGWPGHAPLSPRMSRTSAGVKSAGVRARHHGGRYPVGTKACGQCVEVVISSAALARFAITDGGHHLLGVQQTYPTRRRRASADGTGAPLRRPSIGGRSAGPLQWIVRESHRMRSPGSARSRTIRRPWAVRMGSSSGTGRKSPWPSAYGWRREKASWSRCEPGITQKPPVYSFAGVSSTSPCTHTRPERPGRVPFWSQCHHPPCVRQSRRFSHGRKALPPSKEEIRSLVPQIFSKAVPRPAASEVPAEL